MITRAENYIKQTNKKQKSKKNGQTEPLDKW